MNLSKDYLFTSERLGFRNWQNSDFDAFAAMNADADVMQFFPKILNGEGSVRLMQRLAQHFDEKGYTYFVVDILETSECIGFIGMCNQKYEAPFTPCVDIGWRLAKPFWGKGYATEGAKRCLEYAFETLHLKKIYAVASTINLPSIRVMEKIGMQKAGTFIHPELVDNERLRECVYYNIESTLESIGIQKS